MSADICPKCKEQGVRAGSCEYCGWYDVEEYIHELKAERGTLCGEIDELREENRALRERLRSIGYDYGGCEREGRIGHSCPICEAREAVPRGAGSGTKAGE